MGSCLCVRVYVCVTVCMSVCACRSSVIVISPVKLKIVLMIMYCRYRTITSPYIHCTGVKSASS